MTTLACYVLGHRWFDTVVTETSTTRHTIPVRLVLYEHYCTRCGTEGNASLVLAYDEPPSPTRHYYYPDHWTEQWPPDV